MLPCARSVARSVCASRVGALKPGGACLILLRDANRFIRKTGPSAGLAQAPLTCASRTGIFAQSVSEGGIFEELYHRAAGWFVHGYAGILWNDREPCAGTNTCP